MTSKRDVIDITACYADLLEAALVPVHQVMTALETTFQNDDQTEFGDLNRPDRAKKCAELGEAPIQAHRSLHECLELAGHPLDCQEAIDRVTADKPPEALKGSIVTSLFDKGGPRTPRDLVHYFECRYDWVSEVLRQLYLEGKVVALGRKKPPFDLDTELRVTKRE